jgi:hypothetical protein
VFRLSRFISKSIIFNPKGLRCEKKVASNFGMYNGIGRALKNTKNINRVDKRSS